MVIYRLENILHSYTYIGKTLKRRGCSHTTWTFYFHPKLTIKRQLENKTVQMMKPVNESKQVCTPKKKGEGGYYHVADAMATNLHLSWKDLYTRGWQKPKSRQIMDQPSLKSNGVRLLGPGIDVLGGVVFGKVVQQEGGISMQTCKGRNRPFGLIMLARNSVLGPRTCRVLVNLARRTAYLSRAFANHPFLQGTRHEGLGYTISLRLGSK